MASRGINKAIIVGNLGNDPEMRYLPSGNAVTTISVATSETWTDKNTGQPQERTEWHRIEAFGKLAEIMGQYLRKGSQVYIEGSIRTDKWEDQKTGETRYSTKIRADQMQMLGGRQDGGAANFQNQGQAAPATAPQQNYQQPTQQGGYQQQGGQSAAPQPPNNQFDKKFEKPQMDAADDFSDDIPF